MPHPLNFDELIDAHSDYLLSYALLKTGIKADAEDLVQETFLAAYRNKESFKGEASPKTWLVSILKNKISDYFRKKMNDGKWKQYLDQTEAAFRKERFNDDNHGRWKEIIAPNYFSGSSDEKLLATEFWSIISECVNKLPVRLRGVFISKYLDHTDSENICKEFNISASNYWMIVFRAKTMMRECLEKKEI